MLIGLTKATRRGMAGVITLLYAACVVMPAVAFAIADGARAAHCLTAGGLAHVHRHDVAKPHVAAHVHADGAAHHHHDAGATPQPVNTDEDDGAAGCCGLFCLTAITAAAGTNLGFPMDHSSIFSMAFEELVGRGPDRINRPPKSPLPV